MSTSKQVEPQDTNVVANRVLPMDSDMITVSGPNPPIYSLPVQEMEIKLALLTLANKIQLEQNWS